jgi:ABC-2 type transport system permease protein
MVEDGLNLVPPALCILGIGMLVLGVLPRAATVAVYGVLGWSLLIEIVGGIGALSHSLLDTSVFHQMAAAPAVSPDWRSGGVMVGIGVVCAVIGAAAFRRRDLVGE